MNSNKSNNPNQIRTAAEINRETAQCELVQYLIKEYKEKQYLIGISDFFAIVLASCVFIAKFPFRGLEKRKIVLSAIGEFAEFVNSLNDKNNDSNLLLYIMDYAENAVDGIIWVSKNRHLFKKITRNCC